MAKLLSFVEKRREPRYRMPGREEARVRITRSVGSEPHESTATLVDISRSGVKLRVPFCPGFQEKVSLRIDLPAQGIGCDVDAVVCFLRPSDADHWVLGCAVDPPFSEEVFASMIKASAVERRAFVRQPVQTPVRLWAELASEEVAAELQNVSEGGVCLLLPAFTETGSRIKIRLADAVGKKSSARVHVKWHLNTSSGKLLGCMFSTSEDYQSFLFALTEPSALERAFKHRTWWRRHVPLAAVATLATIAVLVLLWGSARTPVARDTPAPTTEDDALDRLRNAVMATAAAAEEGKTLTSLTSAMELDEFPLAAAAVEPSNARERQNESAAEPQHDVEPSSEIAEDLQAQADGGQHADTSMKADGSHAGPVAIDNSDSETTDVPTAFPEQPSGGKRQWSDSTGNFHVMAELVEADAVYIRLLKENGRFATVPIERLSKVDVEYVRRWRDDQSARAE